MSALRIVPLGGLGEIGMNCMAIEDEDGIVVVDCGVMFPDRELGVDIIHPDFDYLLARREQVRAIVLTHGHEDHIGALPYLLREINVPVHGPPYALALARERLREHDLPGKVDLRPTAPRIPFEIGPFEIEPIRVTHSIADATALALRTPAGLIVHTGDFKIDPAPADGQHFDEARFAELGKEGVRLLLSDSTNVDYAGESGTEVDVGRALARLAQEAPSRLVVSLFASNVHRLGAVLEAARASGRVVCLLGRSVATHTRVASQLGYLRDPGSLLVPPERAQNMERRRLLAVATGTQGEPDSALAKLAAGVHPALTLEAGDWVVLSSRIIPGNEQTVYGIINDLERRGIEVRYRTTDPDVHVSGHACRDEQRKMIDLTEPTGFLPIHGTFHHLTRHARLAHEAGVEDTLVVENGAIVELDDDGLRVGGAASTGRVHVDAGEEIPDVVLRDRALLAELGMAIVVIVVDRQGVLLREPDVVTRGVVHEEAEPELLSAAREYVADALRAYKSPLLEADEGELRDIARRALKRFFARKLGRKPLTYGVVVRVA